MNNDYNKQGNELLYDMVSSVEYVDAYCRYSSHMQDDGNSIEYQMEEIELYCQRHGMVVRKWYIDKAKSAKQAAGRDAFYELIEDIKNGFSAPNLIVWKTNRAFRNSYESHKYRKFLRENNIKLLSVTQTIDEETSAGRLTTNILSDIDQYKSEEIAEHVTAALRSMVKRGFYTGQGIPLGYKVIPALDGDKPRKKYAIDETTAPYVKKIFADFVDGMPPAVILQYMKEQGIKTKTGKTYDYNTLYRMLNNDFYIGTRRYNAKGTEPLILPNAVPAIIDEQTFDAVKHIFLSRRTTEPVKGRKSNRNRLYYLTGKAVCAKCGGSYLGKTCANVPYYMCKNRLRRKECDCMSIQKKHIEPAVFKAIREHIFSAEAIDEIIKTTLAEIKKSPVKEVKNKDDLMKRKAVLNREIAELTQMKLSKEINQEVFIMLKKPKDDELAEIEMNLLAFEQQQKTVIDEKYVRDYLSDLFDKAESKNDDLLKYVIDNTIEKVVIGDSEVIIHLALYFGKPSHKGALAFPNYSLCVSFSRVDITKRVKKS